MILNRQGYKSLPIFLILQEFWPQKIFFYFFEKKC